MSHEDCMHIVLGHVHLGLTPVIVYCLRLQVVTSLELTDARAYTSPSWNPTPKLAHPFCRRSVVLAVVSGIHAFVWNHGHPPEAASL